ncbi:hypothetical protein [Planococcus lenghuensis]|uniref:Aerobactin siderophore biosynthesis IucA/IucC-like C-terminal domain-containing protein n=1 Tax=Planococcus lenghuensis TaxID=2213202 RepID=A0A1Q2KY57_9BACL|nr:hypothetical protein [Planococcus lenghuensis]AQQ52727.1 hypothetical protein B0X71_06180 [Planococcus lenghuensis]
MEGLDRFQLFLTEEPDGFMSLAEAIGSRSQELIDDLKHTTGAPTSAVASSVFMRRFGLFIAGQLYLLAHGQIWDGPPGAVRLKQTAHGIAFSADSRFIRKRKEEDLALVLKQQAAPVVESVRKAGHVSKLILWENIWGYVIWMYGMTDTEQAQADVQQLLDDDFWKPDMKKSHFRQFLNGKTLAESQQDYKRLTCCLYKELPDTDKCPYCPLAK